MDDAGRRLFTEHAIGLAQRYGCKVLTKDRFAGADGIHFTAAGLMQLQEKPPEGLAAASCHTRAELERAMQLELDFVAVGPVRDKAAIGWNGFAELVAGSSIPAYAIGGLSPADRQEAWRAGAHGIAMIRAAWA
jgi:8-oxo-dGTP diphosphatase